MKMMITAERKKIRAEKRKNKLKEGYHFGGILFYFFPKTGICIKKKKKGYRRYKKEWKKSTKIILRKVKKTVL